MNVYEFFCREGEKMQDIIYKLMNAMFTYALECGEDVTDHDGSINIHGHLITSALSHYTSKVSTLNPVTPTDRFSLIL